MPTQAERPTLVDHPVGGIQDTVYTLGTVTHPYADAASLVQQAYSGNAGPVFAAAVIVR